MPVPNPNALSSTFQVGTYTSLTDTFTSVFDLNDGVTTNIMWNTLKMPQPEKAFVRSFNLRAPGERVTRFQYKNRHIQVSVSLRGATVQTILNTVHSLIAAIENPPYRIRFSQPNATQYTYASVVAVTHNIPADPQTLLAKALPNVQIDFECLPGLLGDRVTLSNLVVNPGFEAPSGPNVLVFNDGFADNHAYTVVSGSAPFVGSNLMTVQGNSTISFGSPAWGAINLWQFRLTFATGNVVDFCLHYTNGNNRLQVTIDGAKLYITHVIGGVSHDLSTPTATLTNGTAYWLKITQFPTVAGNPPNVQATLYSDSAGAPGTTVATAGPVATFDAVTALSGKMAIVNRNATNFLMGGAFTAVQIVQLFGPGGWTYTQQSGGAGISPGAWEQNTANTYPGGPVTSYGAARIDCSPIGGPINSYWATYTGLPVAPAGSSAIPVAAAGNVMAASARVQSSSLSVTAQILLVLTEWDASGNFLRQTTLQTLTGNQAAYAQVSGTVPTGASCAYVGVVVSVVDNTASASANGTVWIDNVQCYNQTTTGQTSMPYCELRFPQSPAQLVVSGILGDVPTPAWLGLGTYSGIAASASLQFSLGRRRQVTLSPVLCGAMVTRTSDTNNTSVLDANSYGGFYNTFPSGSVGVPRIASALTNDLKGTYHVYQRTLTDDPTTADYVNDLTYASVLQRTQPGVGATSGADILWRGTGPTVSSFYTAASVWAIVDAGQVVIPPAAAGGLTDLTTTYLQVVTPLQPNGPGNYRQNWLLLLPIDADILMGRINNGQLGATVATSWIWAYFDPINAGQIAQTYSIESVALPNPARGAGGPGTTNSGSVNVTTASDTFLQLDPTQQLNGVNVNQFAGYISDSSGSVLPLALELQYSPIYLYPR